MSDPIPAPAPAEKTVVINDPSLRRLRTLTFLSLGLNGLILFLIVAGAVIHHHRMMHQRFGERDGRDGGFCPDCDMHRDFDRHFHHFGGGFGHGQDWGRHGGFDRGGPGPGGPAPGMEGMGGMRSMMDEPKGPPDPAQMTEQILDHLTTTLALTDDQKDKVKPLVEAQVAQMQKDRETERAARQKEITDGRAKLRPLLNADQQKKLDALPLPGQKTPETKPGE